MCGFLGIKQAFSHAYHHQSNGRAEVAGQQIMEILRKFWVEENANWVHILPRVVNLIHDAVGESGLSPYQIVFGRDRPMANLPYRPTRECEDATDFFEKQRQTDEKVAKVLNEKHAHRQEVINAKRRDWDPFDLGTYVWYRRPENSGGKLYSRWTGPMEIIGREGENSYVLKTSTGDRFSSPRCFLKEFLSDTQREEPIHLHFHRRTEVGRDIVPDKREIEEIFDHDIRGGMMYFLTQWKGEHPRSASWEPPSSFLHGHAQPWAKYCRLNGIFPELTELLDPLPDE